MLTKATIDTTIKIDKDNIAYELMKRRVAVIKTSIIIKFEIIKQLSALSNKHLIFKGKKT